MRQFSHGHLIWPKMMGVLARLLKWLWILRYDSRLKMNVKYLSVSVNVRFPCAHTTTTTETAPHSITRTQPRKCLQKTSVAVVVFFRLYSAFFLSHVEKSHPTHALMLAWYENKLQTNSSKFLHSFMSVVAILEREITTS